MKYFMRNLYKVMVLLFSTLLFSACSEHNDDLENYIHKTKLRTGRTIEPIPEIAEPEKFQYPEQLKRRNPFKPVGKATVNQDELAPDQNRPRMPLEEYALDSLKFVGTLKDGSIRWGLVSQPDGMISRVKPGDYMGKNYGKVIKISNDAIHIEESLKVGGQWKKKKTTFRLKTEG